MDTPLRWTAGLLSSKARAWADVRRARRTPSRNAVRATRGGSTQKNADNPVCVLLRGSRLNGLDIKVHLKLERMRPHSHRIDFLQSFVAYPPIDQRFSEHVALEQEFVIGLERIERNVQRARQRWHVLELFGRHVVNVLVER